MRYFISAISMVILFCIFGLNAQSINEEEIKNSGKYLFEENYDTTEATARQNAYESLKESFKFKYPTKNIAVLNHHVRHLVTRIGFKIQAIAFVPLDSLRDLVKIAPEIISAISDSCSFSVAAQSIPNENVRKKINENASRLLTLLNGTFKKCLNENTKDMKPALEKMMVSAKARKTILSLWETSPFAIIKAKLSGSVKPCPSGYEYRPIPIFIRDADFCNQQTEAVVAFDSNGTIFIKDPDFNSRQMEAVAVFDSNGTIENFYSSGKKIDDNLKTDIANVYKNSGKYENEVNKITSRITDACSLAIAPYSIDNDKIRREMCKNASLLFTTINRAYKKSIKGKPVDITSQLQDIPLSKEGKGAIRCLWKTSPFAICKATLTGPIIKRYPSGYEYRPVHIFIKNATPGNQCEEAVIIFDGKGGIENFGYALHKFKDLVGPDTSIADFHQKQIILDFIENFRTAYNRKDIQLIENFYSDNALIITGYIVRTLPSDMKKNLLPSERVVYRKFKKPQYIAHLKDIFQRDSFINVKMENIAITQHNKIDSVFGVRMTQDWHTSSYGDSGYIFLLIDFRGHAFSPIIHIRTWQPSKLNGHDLKQEEIIDMADFKFES
jgi:hypothetical protein